MRAVVIPALLRAVAAGALTGAGILTDHYLLGWGWAWWVWTIIALVLVFTGWLIVTNLEEWF